MSPGASLTEEEKKWQQHFDRKLEELEGNRTYTTAFLDPRQLELAEAALRKRNNLSYTAYGGYPEAERNVIHVFPAQHRGDLPPVTAVLVEWTGDRESLGHRDLLGAVLALGLRRDQVGDIVIPEEGRATVMVLQAKADFVCSSLNEVGRVPVNCSIVDPDHLALTRGNGKEIKGTVASLRVDSLLSLGFGLSRSKVVRLIKGGLVVINWRPVTSPSLQVEEGDQISLRGRGRILIDEVEGETRKGRIRLKLKKYS